ncbi:MAG: hypothetical protein DMF75_03065 [Acidobacteria bacterium]|nr:MAG: hypothetical protein DMF75_03065 [Acidobacteriota bacterium]PYS64099.1 MAG: hypothetical protein DMF76_05585 [Acidobacteriota bacterium]
MFCFSFTLFSSRVSKLTLFVSVIALIVIAPAQLHAQRSEPEPAFSDFKGVRIGTSVDESRKKLGNPRDKADDQDFYVFNDTQAVQIFYDKTAKVSAISIDYMTGASGIPSPKDVLGTEADKKADGSLYKLVRYPKAGYWVSYSRTAGDSPTTTVTMQKIEH